MDFGRLGTWIAGLNPAQGICPRLSVLCCPV
jgi:hypothetical protein